jgi:hypothetical protein
VLQREEKVDLGGNAEPHGQKPQRAALDSSAGTSRVTDPNAPMATTIQPYRPPV